MPEISRRGFMKMLGLAMPAAAARPTYFFAPRGGWMRPRGALLYRSTSGFDHSWKPIEMIGQERFASQGPKILKEYEDYRAYLETMDARATIPFRAPILELPQLVPGNTDCSFFLDGRSPIWGCLEIMECDTLQGSYKAPRVARPFP